ncbi:hypothetical protein A1O7_09672 [Cladophialophora yegresii CBS 114405]|uniref:Uncharacterized protein n=1 Tax=Cladophialophora yegresii CBS 114405 TaxID=1182544 RepID=W9VFV0_9EURO|nr:uncharacterized protein A1O7_09672 [Cladophialophora yegresii CBS 114405]EXJ54333.1 hypothetical protein A1O7_09672 [Cladophialophora yegresii CBS 114405]
MAAAFLLSLPDADGSTLPELPPNRYFDDLSTVDELLEHSSPVSDGRADVSASLHLSTSGASTLKFPSTAPSQTLPLQAKPVENHASPSITTSSASRSRSAPTTDEIVQLILINEVRAAEERLDADQRALERKTEMIEEAWRAEKVTLDQERWVLAVEKQRLARREEDLTQGERDLSQREKDVSLREQSLQENTDKLQVAQAIFREQKDEFEQEEQQQQQQQRARTQRIRELMWGASEEEVTLVMTILLLCLATRGSSTDILERLNLLGLAALDMLHNHVSRRNVRYDRQA